MDSLDADAIDSDLLATARAHGHMVGPALLDPYIGHLHDVCCERCNAVFYESDLPQTSRIVARVFQFDGERESARLTTCQAAPALTALPAERNGLLRPAVA